MSNKSNEEIRSIIREELRALIEEKQKPEEESVFAAKARKTTIVVGKGTQEILGTTFRGASDIVGTVGSLLEKISELF